jgi:hypothetical protein
MAPSSLLDIQEAASKATTCTACQTVFGTAELVEQILVHLPAKQLFSSQRVCKNFTNAIAASPEIQVKMWRRLPDCPQKQASGAVYDSMEGNHPAQTEVPGGAGLETNSQSRPILSPWLAVVPRMRKCWKGMRPREMRLRFSWRRSARQYFFTAKEDSYLDTYFCDPPCRTITVQQTYLVDGDDFENTQDVQIDTPMTIREVLDKALDQTGPITDSFSQEPVIQCGTMRAITKSHEEEKGCTDGSKTVLSKVEFVLHGVHNPVILDDATTGSNESMFSHRLLNRKIVTSRARASMAM